MKSKYVRYYDEEEQEFETSDSVGGCDEIIDAFFNSEPKDKRTKEHSLWKTKINTVILQCNRLAGFRRYNPVK